jgi:hypothetical protein
VKDLYAKYVQSWNLKMEREIKLSSCVYLSYCIVVYRSIILRICSKRYETHIPLIYMLNQILPLPFK